MKYTISYQLPMFRPGGPVFHFDDVPFVPRTGDKVVLDGNYYKACSIEVSPNFSRTQITVHLETF